MEILFEYIPKNTVGRRIVIGDIHSCIYTLKTLLEKHVVLTTDDQLFLVGDYVSKGPYPKKTLNYLIGLQKAGFQIFPVRGNHEEAILYFSKKPVKYLWLHLKLTRNIKLFKYNKIKKKFLKFFENTKYFYELDEFLIVHAGFNFYDKKPYADTKSMITIKNLKYDRYSTRNKTIIHGHTPKSLHVIIGRIATKSKIIPLDNGVYYSTMIKEGHNSKMGYLCAYNLDTRELIMQPNIERNPLENTKALYVSFK